MYREHLLSIEHVQKLLYHQVQSDQPGKRTLRAPAFFISQGDKGLKTEFFPRGSEAERRISFFAQSLTTAMPEPIPIDSMPTFTVLVPHYSEKILLSLREIIREEDQNTRVTLLEYLKQLHPIEWDNFVRDTKILAEESNMFNGGGNPFGSDEKAESKRADDIPFYTVGFKSAAPEYTLRTRIWASLRAQTLYRTVSGFMNYSKAIKLLYRVENPEVVQLFGGNTDQLERELERMARRKFKFVVSMQRYSKFNKEEHENAEFLLRAYPDLQIAYLDEEPARKDGAESRIFSALIDGHSEIMPNGRRRPKFRIELPGNPILGDGKSDNQNHAIVFYRGEYLQLIDANQDNYLEECLKIRNVLGEFEEYRISAQSPYAVNGHTAFDKFPVAILGAREYIFSENIGILGDIAAGKEQTFGTLAARSLSFIGGKLHYGHPDFLNAIYMNTRGGVSKAQKGLHLNEDIYAGMTAFGRGGRIKHSEYYQCGKGRDLGFGTILNFQTKIGTGMGEQMLSREYYYLGTQLPVDRFLTFYYGHPGFHINNILVMMSVQIFMLALVFLGTLNKQLPVCKYNSKGDILPGQSGCYNLQPVFKWIKRCIISIFLVFWIAFVPLFVQELTERGTGRAILRLVKHFLSLSPVFEVFSTQIYMHSILNNLTFGGARYIATGRGFATTRISFSILYSRFAGPSIYLGLRTLILLLYITMSVFVPHLIYFWITVVGLCVAPFLFNPHQFSFTDFIIDYREFLRWMSRGQLANPRQLVGRVLPIVPNENHRFQEEKTGFTIGETLQRHAPSAMESHRRGRDHRACLHRHSLCHLLSFRQILRGGRQDATWFASNRSRRTRSNRMEHGPPRHALPDLRLPRAMPQFMHQPIWSDHGRHCALRCCSRHDCLFRISLVPRTVGRVARCPRPHSGDQCAEVHLQDSHCGVPVSRVQARRDEPSVVDCKCHATRKQSVADEGQGVWFNRGLGSHALSQPAREFVVKTIEMGLYSADFLACHSEFSSMWRMDGSLMGSLSHSPVLDHTHHHSLL